jgi:predicted anti-sigma-YlaC factor YlaD
MNCPTSEQLQRFLDQELPAKPMLLIEHHLKTCDSCRERFEELEQSVELIRESIDTLGPAPTDIRPFVGRRSVEAGANRWSVRRRLMASLAAAAALVLIALLSINGPEPPSAADPESEYLDPVSFCDPNEAWLERQIFITYVPAGDSVSELIVTSHISTDLDATAVPSDSRAE